MSKDTPVPRVDQNSARIDGLLAREAPIVVLFRRGPSKSVGLFRWDLRDDRIEEGQWFWGRIFTRRCDLSPNGELLCYFAGRFKDPLGTWTAISRPPYLTALALWPNGDTWGGGGLFETHRTLGLNHSFGEAGETPWTPRLDGLPLPRRFEVRPLHEGAGAGEDEPIESMRLVRDGWTWIEGPSRETESRSGPIWITYDPPYARTKPIAGSHKREPLLLRVLLHGLKERDGRWNVESGQIVTQEGAIVRDLGRIDWADTSPNGDVLYSTAGCVWRLPRSAVKREGEPRLVADLNAHRFRPMVTPEEMCRWP